MPGLPSFGHFKNADEYADALGGLGKRLDDKYDDWGKNPWKKKGKDIRPKGSMPGPQGAKEWGKKNGIKPQEAQKRFHDIKKDDKMSGATDNYSVNPDTGDVFDPAGDPIGNLGEY